MNQTIIPAIFTVLLLSSCVQNTRMTIANGNFDLSLDASLPEMPLMDTSGMDEGDKTKASTQYTVRIKWAQGDQLSVINMTTGKILGGSLSANTSGTASRFSGSLNGSVNEGDLIAFFYPSQGNAEEENFEKISTDMSDQGGTTGSVPLCVYSTAVASRNNFDNISLGFSFLMGYMMMGLSDIPATTSVKSVTLTNLTNSFGLSINKDKTGFDITAHQGDIVLTPGQNASTSGVKTIYAAIPESSAATRHAILETSTTTFTTSFTSAKLNNGYAYNTNVSGFLVDDLVPADSGIRNYCLEHFDANDDGKLSMVEIAGVTSFPDQSSYPLPSDITRFNELEYFYGLTALPTFKNQKKLECITIPKQICAIPDDMFYGCTTLTKVILKPSVPPTLGSNVFYGLSGSIILIVDDAVVADYQTAPGWCDFYNNFRTDSSQNDSSLDIDTEDENSMEEDRIDIIVK
jgi:hypothetical protein